MFAQYFGQFLLNRGLVTAANLDRAMTAQKETRVKLGVLAINHGYMSAEQVETVHQAQTRMDKRFGEIAVDLGFISEEQITALLSSQQSAHLVLGQALIDQDIMSYESFSDALSLYKEEYSLSDEQFESILNGSIDTLLEAVLMKGGILKESVLADYIRLFAKNVIRFIDSSIRMDVGSPNEFDAYEWVAQQPILSGSLSTSRLTAIGGSETSFLQLASIYAQETVDTPGEMMEAAVGEFLNLHNGIYLVNRSSEGVELEMAPQSVIHGSEFLLDSPVSAVIRIVGTQLHFDLILTDLAEIA